MTQIDLYDKTQTDSLIAGKADDNAVVKLSGDQTINDVKTFASNPKGANPASGAVDNSVVNANWASQSGDDAPNNLVHRNGNETVNGMKTMTVGMNIVTILSADSEAYTWYKVATIDATKYLRLTLNISLPYNNVRYCIMDVVAIIPRTGDPSMMSLARLTRVINVLPDQEYIGIAWDGTNFNLYMRSGQHTHNSVYVTEASSAGTLLNANGVIHPITPVKEDPTAQINYLIV